MAKLNIVLHEPEIPANTGNIGRTCVAKVPDFILLSLWAFL